MDNILRQFEILFITHIYSIVGATVFIIITILFSYWIGIILRFVLTKYVDKSVVVATVRASRITIIILSFTTVLSEFDINITSLIAGFGIFGFALAIGLRPLTTNFFTGIVINAAKPFKEGDYIESDDIKGIVGTVHWFHTVIVTDDGTYVSVPHGPLWAKSIKNLTRTGPRKIGLEITVGAESGFRETKALLKTILSASTGRLSGFGPAISVKDSNSKHTIIETASWHQPASYWEARETLPKAVSEGLSAAGVNVIKVKVLSSPVRRKAVRKRIAPAKSEEKAVNA